MNREENILETQEKVLGNSFIIVNERFFNCKNVPVVIKAVYVTLTSFVNRKTKQCFPSYSTIADNVGVDRKTVINAIHTLEEAHLVKKQRRITNKNEFTSNLFEILEWNTYAENYFLKLKENSKKKKKQKKELKEFFNDNNNTTNTLNSLPKEQSPLPKDQLPLKPDLIKVNPIIYKNKRRKNKYKIIVKKECSSSPNKAEKDIFKETKDIINKMSSQDLCQFRCFTSFMYEKIKNIHNEINLTTEELEIWLVQLYNLHIQEKLESMRFKEIIDFALSDPFWQCKVISPETFKKYFGTIKNQLLQKELIAAAKEKQKQEREEKQNQPKRNRFVNYDQREWDWDKIERLEMKYRKKFMEC